MIQTVKAKSSKKPKTYEAFIAAASVCQAANNEAGWSINIRGAAKIDVVRAVHTAVEAIDMPDAAIPFHEVEQDSSILKWTMARFITDHVELVANSDIDFAK